MEKTTETLFKAKQEVVYPTQGVGRIEKIEEKEFKGKKVLYYVIYLEVSDMTVMIPTSKAEELGVRAIVSPEESKKALELITKEYEPVPTDWKTALSDECGPFKERFRS